MINNIAQLLRTNTYAGASLDFENMPAADRPSYGYDWNVTTNTGHKAVMWKAIRNLLTTTGAVPQWWRIGMEDESFRKAVQAGLNPQ